MAQRENQTALDQYRDLLLAAIDYYIEKFAGTIVYDQFDPIAHHYAQLKQQTEKYYQHRRLDRLQQKLHRLTVMLRQRGIADFQTYIKEKTGYEIDPMGSLPARIEKIIEQKIITNKDQYRDVLAMIGYLQPGTEQDKINVLNKLRVDFDGKKDKPKTRKKVNYADSYIYQSHSPDNKRIITISQNANASNQGVTSVVIHFEKASGTLYAAKGIDLCITPYWKDDATIVIETKNNYTTLAKHSQVKSFGDTVTIEYIET